MENINKVIAGILVTAFFIFLITALSFVYVASIEGAEIPSLFQPFLQYHVEFMIIMGLVGFVAGIVIYNNLISTIQRQKKTNVGIVMKFLEDKEREILELLLKRDGMTTQSEISRLPGMNRLKAHRIVKKLEKRGIIYIEKNGKVNMVRLIDELKEK
ncbi:MAG: winged helix-turn-helix transcriptional regulator [Candidatus Anstonellales archaeon]